MVRLCLRLIGSRSGALREVAALVLAPLAKKLGDTGFTKPIQLVDRAKHRELLVAHRVTPIASITPSSTFRLFTLMTYCPRSKPSASIVSAAIMQISASAAGRGRADRIGIELHELAEAARPRLLVAEHPAGAVAAIRLRQALVILRHEARERRGQIVAEREPLLVLVLEGEHALVRAGPGRAGICRAPRCIRRRASPPARSRSARRRA